MVVTTNFETDIFPFTSIRGFSVAVLAGIGVLLCIGAAAAPETQSVAFPVFLALLALFGAFSLHFSYQNFAVDLEGQRYRHFHGLLGLKVGTWQELPPVSGVIMKHFSELPIAGRRGWQVEDFLHYCIVMLSTQAINHEGIIVYKFPYRDKAQAVRLTTDLAQYFGVTTRIYDAPEGL